MTPTFADLAAAKYVLLTTFRKDGTPVPTAVWAAADADRLLVWTVTDSYKVKRLRRDPRITLAVCDVRGNPRSDAVPGTATVLDAAGTVGIACAVDAGATAPETGTPAPGHGG